MTLFGMVNKRFGYVARTIMPPELFAPKLAKALTMLFAKDEMLFNLGMDGVNEQTITFRLGYYLQGLFDEHEVDCEYNRRFDETKRVSGSDSTWMKPDLIIHKRNSDLSNLVCIEATKTARWNSEFPAVENKLIALTSLSGDYRYQLGLAWRIAPSGDLNRQRAFWFRNGLNHCESSLQTFLSDPHIVH